ncbi:MAG: enoyl-CoA hydratase/isomerase family protein [Actinomycetota bacterium]
MNDQPVIVEHLGAVALVRLNRPASANAITREMLALLEEIGQQLAIDPLIGAVVVTGTGRHFCAGVDLDQALTGPPVANGGRFGLSELPQPVIAGINGTAMGGGLEIALACDYRFMAEGAMVGLPEVKFGELPLLGGTARLPRLVGPSAAKRMILTGEPVDAATALRMGLVDEVCDSERVLASALLLAETLSRNASFAVRTGKRLIDEAFEGSIDDALDREVVEVRAMATDVERLQARRIAAERSPIYAKLFREDETRSWSNQT